MEKEDRWDGRAEMINYLRNINTRPGPNAGRSIDPSKPGPDADRIAELVSLWGNRPAGWNDPFSTNYEGEEMVQQRIAWRDELSRLRNEQPWCEHSNCPPHECDACSPSPAPLPEPQDVREALERAGRWFRQLHEGKAQDEDSGAVWSAVAAALAQSDAQPVGWRYAYRSYPNQWHLTTLRSEIDMARDKGCIIEPLYTAPPRPDASGLIEAVEAVLAARMPRSTLKPGGATSIQDYKIESSAVWAFDKACKQLEAALRARAADRSGT